MKNNFISISDLKDSELEENNNKEQLPISNNYEKTNNDVNNEEKLNLIKSEIKTIIKNIYKNNDNYNINYNQNKINEKQNKEIENKEINKKHLKINTSSYEQIEKYSQKNTIIRTNSIELGNKSPLIIKNNEKINNITLPKSNDKKKKI